MALIYPVIHFAGSTLALEQVGVARDNGADGAFLISHRGEDLSVLKTAFLARGRYPGFPVGINLLSTPPLEACAQALRHGLPMVWADDMDVDSRGRGPIGAQLADFAHAHGEITLFASVAFKYRAEEPDPPQAARVALVSGFLPTTSGPATGRAPELPKIEAMSQAAGGRLAIASGMTPENVAPYARLASHLLVATGIGRDEYCIDPARLRAFVAAARGAGHVATA